MTQGMPSQIALAIARARAKANKLPGDKQSPFGGYYISPEAMFDAAERIAREESLDLIPTAGQIEFGNPVELSRSTKLVGKRSQTWVLAYTGEGGPATCVIHEEVPLEVSNRGAVGGYLASKTNARKAVLAELFQIREGEPDHEERAAEIRTALTATGTQVKIHSTPSLPSSVDGGGTGSEGAPTQSTPAKPPPSSSSPVRWGSDVALALHLGAFPGGPEKTNAAGDVVVPPPDPSAADLEGAGWAVAEGLTAEILASLGATNVSDPVDVTILRDFHKIASRSGLKNEQIGKIFGHCGAEFGKGAEVTPYQLRLAALCAATWAGKVE